MSGAAMDAPVVEVRDVRKTFRFGGGHGELVAVDDVSFSVRRGECLGIVGESGSGKTTLAKLLLGIETKDAGSIVVSGRARDGAMRATRERRRRARELQLVFQDPFTSLDPRQTGLDTIREVLRLHFPQRADGDRRARAHELMDHVGLDQRQRGALPRDLSGGQRQRIAIARALAAEPDTIILDEAVASLDVSIQAQVLNLLSDLRRDTHVSFIFISHDLAVIRQLADQVIVMRQGSVVERGETAAVLDHPTHPYTQLLRAAIPRPGWRPQRVQAADDALAGPEA